MKALIILSIFSSISVCLIAQNKKANQVTLPKVVVVETPTIEWITYPVDSAIVSTSVQSFACLVKSRLPLQRVEIKVNGLTSDVYSDKDFSKPVDKNQYEQRIERTVALRTGYNNIVVIVDNVKGIRQESMRRVIVDPNQITLLRNEKDQTPPMIFVSSPSVKDDRTRIYQEMVKITGTVMDESGIQQLVINGIRTPVRENGAFIINLPLNMGETHITIEAKDINQNIGLKKFIIERKNMDGSNYTPEAARNYLIVIGVNQYKSWPQLYNAVSDSRSVFEVLTSNYKFEPEDVTFLVDSMATRFHITDALRKHIEKVSPKDNLLIYYSGHGYFDKLLNEGYWVPVEAQRGDISAYIPNSQILKIIENIESQHTFLVADACFSGSLFSNSTRGYTEQVEKYKSRWALASGRLEEVSDGTIGLNSPFTQSFVEFLKNNKDSKVAVSDLVQYVKKKVTEVNAQTPMGNPLKNVGDEGGEFVFYKRQ